MVLNAVELDGLRLVPALSADEPFLDLAEFPIAGAAPSWRGLLPLAGSPCRSGLFDFLGSGHSPFASRRTAGVGCREELGWSRRDSCGGHQGYMVGLNPLDRGPRSAFSASVGVHPNRLPGGAVEHCDRGCRARSRFIRLCNWCREHEQDCQGRPHPCFLISLASLSGSLSRVRVNANICVHPNCHGTSLARAEPGICASARACAGQHRVAPRLAPVRRARDGYMPTPSRRSRTRSGDAHSGWPRRS